MSDEEARMATKKQLRANRENARKSTGPKTAAGKSAVRLNSLVHGLRARDAVLPDERVSDYRRLSEGIDEAIGPEGLLEVALTQRVVLLLWRLARAARIEVGVLAKGHFEAVEERANAEARQFVDKSWGFPGPDKITDPKAHAECLLRSAQAAAAVHEAPGNATHAFLKDVTPELQSGHLVPPPDALAKVTRYETSLERALYRTLHELQRLQSVRLKRRVQPLVAVEIEEDGLSASVA